LLIRSKLIKTFNTSTDSPLYLQANCAHALEQRYTYINYKEINTIDFIIITQPL